MILLLATVFIFRHVFSLTTTLTVPVSTIPCIAKPCQNVKKRPIINIIPQLRANDKQFVRPFSRFVYETEPEK